MLGVSVYIVYKVLNCLLCCKGFLQRATTYLLHLSCCTYQWGPHTAQDTLGLLFGYRGSCEAPTDSSDLYQLFVLCIMHVSTAVFNSCVYYHIISTTIAMFLFFSIRVTTVSYIQNTILIFFAWGSRYDSS